MDYLELDGKIAVILAKDYKAQWFTFHKVGRLLTDPLIVWFIQNWKGSLDEALEIEEYCDRKYGVRDFYGDVTSLKVEWVSIYQSWDVKMVKGWETIVIGDTNDQKTND